MTAGKRNPRSVVLVGAASLATAVILLSAWAAFARTEETLRRSDAFWGALQISASNRESYSSLEEMARASDVVVVATIRAVAAGRTFGDHPAGHPDPDAGFVHYLSATLEIHDVLRGDPLPAGSTVEFILPNPELVDRLAAGLPAEPAIFFLRSKQREAASLGLSDEVQKRERLYFRLVTTEALLRRVDQEARAVYAESPFLIALDGSDFTSLVSRIRQVN